MFARYCARQWNDNYNKEINNFLKELSHEKDAFSAKLMQLRTMAEISRMSQQKRGDPNTLWHSGKSEEEKLKTPDVDAYTEIQQVHSHSVWDTEPRQKHTSKGRGKRTTSSRPQ